MTTVASTTADLHHLSGAEIARAVQRGLYTARDVTDIVHPATRRICERAALITGLDVCGIDLMTNDISQPLPERAGRRALTSCFDVG